MGAGAWPPSHSPTRALPNVLKYCKSSTVLFPPEESEVQKTGCAQGLPHISPRELEAEPGQESIVNFLRPGCTMRTTWEP